MNYPTRNCSLWDVGENMRKKGKIVHWNAEKAFGFIEPSGGGKQVFAHITAFKTKDKTPTVGRSVSFQLAKDKDGRLCAAKVLYAGEKAAPKRKRGKTSGSVWIIPIYFLALFASVVVTGFPFFVLGWQLLISLITFLMYAKDKSAAKKGKWRTTEATLHLFAVVGGWPGALLAQQAFRHKSKKLSFRVEFWISVVLSISAVVWLHTEQGRGLLNIATEKAEIEWSQSR